VTLRDESASPRASTGFDAAIFDMDGLLIDSEPLWHEAEIAVLGSVGVPLVASACRQTKGMFVNEVVAYYHGLVSWEGPSVAEVADQVLERVGELVEEKGRLLPGATRALGLCRALGPVALASSTPTSLIARVLAHFSLTDAFDVVHSAEHEDRGKPDPAVFLTTAAQLGVEPSRCLVFEDSAAGVSAARAARMGCVAVPAADEREDPAFGDATIVLGSLADLDERWLAASFGAGAPADGSSPGRRR